MAALNSLYIDVNRMNMEKTLQYQLEMVPRSKKSVEWSKSDSFIGNADQDTYRLKKTRQARIMSAYQDALEVMEEGQKLKEYSGQMNVITRPIKKPKKLKTPSEPCCPPCCSCSHRVKRALRINKDMLPLKLLYVLVRGALACITPYLAVHLSQRGFDPLQSGFMASVSALVTALLTPFLGFIADRFQCRKGLLLASISVWLMLTMCLNFVPSPRRAPCKEAFGNLLGTIGVSEEDQSTCEQLVANGFRDEVTLEPLHVLNVFEPVSNFSAACPVNRIQTNVRILQTQKREDLLEVFRAPDNFRKHKAATGADRSWLYDAESLQTTFSFVFLLLTLGEAMQAATLFLMDTATLHRLGPGNRASYGWQRSFGSAGYAMYAVGLAEWLDMARESVVVCGIVVPITDYRIATVVFAGSIGCAVTLIVASTCLKLKYESSSPFEYQLSDMKPIVLSWHYGSIVITALFLSVCNGCADSFLYQHLTRLGATQFLFGIVLAVQGGSELLVASQAALLIKRFGHVTLLYAGLGAYFTRFVLCAMVTNPWWIIPGEILKGMSIALTWNIFTSYMSEAVPVENLATLQGFITGLYYGLGRGVGLMLGGLMVQSFGTFMTFAACAVACVGYTIIFLVIQRSSEQPYSVLHVEYTQIASPSNKDDDVMDDTG